MPGNGIGTGGAQVERDLSRQDRPDTCRRVQGMGAMDCSQRLGAGDGNENPMGRKAVTKREPSNHVSSHH